MNFDMCEALIKGAPVGISYFKIYNGANEEIDDLEFIMMNDAFSQLTGLSKSEMIGMKISDLERDDSDASGCCRQILNAISGDLKIKDICQVRGACKSFFRVNFERLSIERLAIYLYDVTEEKLTIEALEKLREEYDLKSDQLERFFSVNLDLLCIADVEGNFVKLNKAWETTLGFTLEELYKHKFFDFIHPDDIDATHESVERLADQKEVLNFTNRYRTSDGSYKFIEWRSHPHGIYIYAAARDITERVRYINEQKNILEALRASEEKYRLIAENIGDVIWIYNMTQDKMSYMSPSIIKQRGFMPEEMLGEGYKKTITPASFEILNERIHAYYQEYLETSATSGFRGVECEVIAKDGTHKWVEVTVTFKRNLKDEVEIYGVTRDISYVKKAEALQYIGNHDQLTGLYNRHFFDTIILDEMKRSDRYSDPISLIMFDIDHFKLVNDTWGHPVGDELLKLIASVTKGVIRSSDIFVRFGGEEFLVLMPETEKEGAAVAAEKIRLAVEVNSHPITGPQTVSLGVAERKVGESFIEWYKRVDKAMYAAKRLGRNRVMKAE